MRGFWRCKSAFSYWLAKILIVRWLCISLRWSKPSAHLSSWFILRIEQFKSALVGPKQGWLCFHSKFLVVPNWSCKVGPLKFIARSFSESLLWCFFHLGWLNDVWNPTQYSLIFKSNSITNINKQIFLLFLSFVAFLLH